MWPCVAGVGRCTRACVRAGRTPPGAARSLSAAPRGPPLSCLSEFLATTVSSRRVQTLRFSLLPYVLNVCLRRPSLTHSSLARTSRTG